jgi:hypothetical protein
MPSEMMSCPAAFNSAAFIEMKIVGDGLMLSSKLARNDMMKKFN